MARADLHITRAAAHVWPNRVGRRVHRRPLPSTDCRNPLKPVAEPRRPVVAAPSIRLSSMKHGHCCRLFFVVVVVARRGALHNGGVGLRAAGAAARWTPPGPAPLNEANHQRLISPQPTHTHTHTHTHTRTQTSNNSLTFAANGFESVHLDNSSHNQVQLVKNWFQQAKFGSYRLT